MQRIPWRAGGVPTFDRRTWLLVSGLAGTVILLLFTIFAVDFNRQRAQQRRIEAELERNTLFLATAQPAATQVAQLEIQLRNTQARLAQAQAALPGPDQQVGVVQRILAAAEVSGVTVTQLQAAGEETNGVVTAITYQIAAEGPIQALGDFAARLEREAFPAARLTEANISQTDEVNVLASTLVIYGSSLRGGVVTLPTQSPQERAAELRAQFQRAFDGQDYETALSLLTRLRALEPNAPDLDDLFYTTHVAYGEYLLALNRPDLAEEQFTAALAIRSDGEEAVLGLLKVAAARTPTPPIGGTAVPGVVTTPTPLPFATATPAIPTTFPPTVAPPPTNTRPPAQPTRALPPTQVVPTATSPPTATQSPSATPNPYQFTASYPFFRPNCALTQVFGQVQTENGTPLNGIPVRVWWDGARDDQVYSLPSGEDPTKPAGYWDVVLDNKPKQGRWYAQIIDRQTGKELSPKVTFETDTTDCRIGGSGHQVVEINFTRVGTAQIGTPGPTSTATRVPSSTPIPSSTPTITPTPTSSPTATPTPIVIAKNENPDMPIPDDPEQKAVSTVEVTADVAVRYVEVFVNILHPNAGDLEIALVSPRGTRVTLHERGQDAGARNLQREFKPSSNAPQLGTAFTKESAHGVWALEVIDKIESNEGNLAQWELKIFP